MDFHAQRVKDAKSCEILLIGNELLIGKTRDLNGYWLSKNFSRFGVWIYRITMIHDDIHEIKDVVQEILSRKPDYLIISGGLGPTFDDMTMKGLSLALDLELYLDNEVLNWIKARYLAGHRSGIIKDPTINEAREKMAYIPAGSKALSNPVGAAPGILIHHQDTKIFVLPGVPREMQAIFMEHVAPILSQENKELKFFHQVFVVNGVGESTMAKSILELMEKIDDRIWIKSQAKFDKETSGYVEMNITGFGDDDLERKILETVEQVKNIIKKLGGVIHEKDVDVNPS
ncbi:MAG: competence/damage-inducible protein A [Promethearchaeota archaeon]